jgi:hypothetical protein
MEEVQVMVDISLEIEVDMEVEMQDSERDLMNPKWYLTEKE